MEWDKIISLGVGACGSIVSCIWGGWDLFLQTLVLFMTIDYIMGMACGYITHTLSSKIAFKGIAKKVAILAIIAVAFSVDQVTSAGGVVRGMVLFFYIGQEGISIAENASVLDVPIPKKLRDRLVQLKEGNKKGGPQ